MSEERFESWAVVDLLGHKRLAGKVSEENRFGTVVGRIDIPKPDGGFTTVYFSGASIYQMTPCTEEVARAAAKGSQPEPVHAWEMPKLPSPANVSRDFSDAAYDNYDEEGEREEMVDSGDDAE